jgi:hypothetical protein
MSHKDYQDKNQLEYGDEPEFYINPIVYVFLGLIIAFGAAILAFVWNGK